MIEQALKERYATLLAHPIVQSSTLVAWRENQRDGYLRVRCDLINGDFLEIALNLELDLQSAQIHINDYRYQWMNSQRQQLYRRWDRAPHFPALDNFPHHVHVGAEEIVESSSLLDVAELLDWLAENIQ